MRRIGIKSDVGDHANRRNVLLDPANSSWNEPIGIPSLLRSLCSQMVFQNREQSNRLNSFAMKLLDFYKKPIDGQPLNSGQRMDWLRAIFPLDHKKRSNEIGCIQLCFLHHIANRFCATVSS